MSDNQTVPKSFRATFSVPGEEIVLVEGSFNEEEVITLEEREVEVATSVCCCSDRELQMQPAAIPVSCVLRSVHSSFDS